MEIDIRFVDDDIKIWKVERVNNMDIESLVVTTLDTIEEADDTDADEVVFRFNRDQIREVAEAYRKIDWIEIY